MLLLVFYDQVQVAHHLQPLTEQVHCVWLSALECALTLQQRLLSQTLPCPLMEAVVVISCQQWEHEAASFPHLRDLQLLTLATPRMLSAEVADLKGLCFGRHSGIGISLL